MSAGSVPKALYNSMQQVPSTPHTELEQYLSASQYMQCLVNPHTAQRCKYVNQANESRSKPTALCVDHQLRPESHAECQRAAEQASMMGLETHIMQVQWPQLPVTGHLMEQASIMRYQLLHQACKARNISVLLTGHHAGMQCCHLMMHITAFPILTTTYC